MRAEIEYKFRMFPGSGRRYYWVMTFDGILMRSSSNHANKKSARIHAMEYAHKLKLELNE